MELAVHPNYRGKGLGTLLHNRLIEESQHKTAVLTTQVDNNVARSLYHHLKWIVIKEPFYPSQDTPFVIMGKKLKD